MSTSQAGRGGFIPVLVTVLIVMAIVAVGAMLLPKTTTVVATQANADGNDGASIAVIAGFIPTFGATLGAAELAELLKGEGPFTVFAPAEGAYGKLPAGTLQDLMKPENKAALQAVMRYHIVLGRFTVADLKGMSSLQTLGGATLAVSADARGITVNGARVITPDLLATNGVIHVINAVLMPPD